MGRGLSCVVQVDPEHNHKHPYKRGTGGSVRRDVTAEAERFGDAMQPALKIEEEGHLDGSVS